jgi:hypothetical protein
MIAGNPLARGVAWTALSLFAFAAALFATLPVLVAAQLLVDVPHLTQMTLWSVVWGLLSMAGVLVAARLAFGQWLSISPLAILLAATGVALSAIVHVVLQQWEIQRFGLVEPDNVGLTAGLFALLIGLSTAAFGAMVAPKTVRAWPAAATVAGAVAVAGVVALNLPGLDDGLAQESWPLAIWLSFSLAYALVAAASVVRRLREG